MIWQSEHSKHMTFTRNHKTIWRQLVWHSSNRTTMQMSRISTTMYWIWKSQYSSMISLSHIIRQNGISHWDNHSICILIVTEIQNRYVVFTIHLNEQKTCQLRVIQHCKIMKCFNFLLDKQRVPCASAEENSSIWWTCASKTIPCRTFAQGYSAVVNQWKEEITYRTRTNQWTQRGASIVLTYNFILLSIKINLT